MVGDILDLNTTGKSSASCTSYFSPGAKINPGTYWSGG
jgi:hypothetical protein